MLIRSLVAAAGMATGVASAHTDVYIALFEFNNGRVAAVGADGTNPRVHFALPTSFWLPNGLAYAPSSGHFYLGHLGTPSTIFRTDSAGGGLTVLNNFTGNVRGSSLDASGRIYFADGNKLRRVNADGSGLMTLFTSSGSWSIGAPKVDATNGHVYFGDQGEIRRTNLSGGNLKTLVRGRAQVKAVALDVASGRIYFCDSDTNSDYIGRANLDGSGIVMLHDNSPSVAVSSGLNDLALVPSQNVIAFIDDVNRVVRTIPIAGGPATTIYTAPGSAYPTFLALSTGEPAQALRDCNGNAIADDVDIAGGAPDCDNNGAIDTCQASACVARNFLLDNGDDAADGSGRSVTSFWKAYQPFDVPAQGWAVSELGLDGYTYNFHDGQGFAAEIFADDGTGEAPHEFAPIASITGNFQFNAVLENWVYLPLQAQLPQGRYWLRLSGVASSTYVSTANYGTSGLGSRTRGGSNSLSQPGRPMAVRIVGSLGCPADFNDDGFVNGDDYDAFATLFDSADPGADFNHDGFVNGDDYDAFASAFDAGC